ncbi:MAG TPA: tetratricopeptide repeat protein [Polyangiales bacterium]
MQALPRAAPTSAAQPSQLQPAGDTRAPSTQATPDSAPRSAPSTQRPADLQAVTDETLRHSCNSGEQSACVSLADRRKNDLKASPQDMQEMLALYQTACDRGAADGCAGLASTYQLGLGVSRDLPKALALYSQACNARSARGCSRLGALYLAGAGVPKSAERAIGYSQAGCDGDDALGCVNAGLMAERGDGLPREPAHARELYEKACRLGEGAGCRQLGSLYAAGFAGEPANPKLALIWSEKACRLKDGAGCGNAGMSYQVGFGVAANPARAASLYKSACDYGEQRFCQLLERFARGVKAQARQQPQPATPAAGQPH